ncbi:bifunctional nuclease family protein [Granulicella cerasi]|uniref:Bifunctional nuclease family protein n=1 Tax=Granulicella cerasi TaxID=741063 RepID=A0ABW1Z3S6_9BACT|nr:bifunctional nuclease family protein [Granulicella cerasi]
MQLPGFKYEPDPATTADPEVEVKVRGLMMDPSTKMPIVVLNDLDGEVVLPIWVGLLEANAIAIEIEKASMPRPMTHDLMRNLVQAMNGQVTRVVVAALREDTFYATVWVSQEGEPVALDARPSDAIALALRADCPIYVSKSVLEHAREAATQALGARTPEDVKQWLEELNDDDLGDYKM